MNPTDAMNLLLEMEEEGQPWNRPYIGGQTVEAHNAGNIVGGGTTTGETTTGGTTNEATTQNSQNVFSPEEIRENRAQIELQREQAAQRGHDALVEYPCGEGPDIKQYETENNTGWVPHVADGVYNTRSGGPYGIGSFVVGDSDYPCPDARYYKADQESDFNTDGVRLSSLPPDQQGEPRMIPTYQWYLELQSKPSDWKNGVANPSDAVKQFSRAIVGRNARDRELTDKLKNGQVSCVEDPCPRGYICGEGNICVEPEPPSTST